MTGIPSGLGLTDGGETTKYKYKGSLNEEVGRMENSESVAYRDFKSGTIDEDKLSQAQMNHAPRQNSGVSDFENEINVGISDLEKVTLGLPDGYKAAHSEGINIDQNYS